MHLPKTMEEALEIDKETETMFWMDAIEKEMKNVMVTFKILEEGEKPPVESQLIDCHMIFDVKINFIRKVHAIAGLGFGPSQR